MALGVNPLDTGLMETGMKIQSDLLQNLGRQLRQDVQTIQTQRQLSGLAQNIQQVDPNSPDFSQKMVGLMSQYPMAAKSPIGQAAINTLGAQHKAYLQEQAIQRNPWSSAGQGVFYNKATGETKVDPSLRPPDRPVPISRTTVALQNPRTGEVTSVEEFGLPMPTITDPLTMEEERQKNRIEMLDERQRRAPSQEVKRLGDQVSDLTERHSKSLSDLAKYEGLANQGNAEAVVLAAGIRKEILNIRSQLDKASSELKAAATQPSIVPASPLSGLGADGMPQGAVPQTGGSDILVPPELVEPSLTKPSGAIREFNYTPGQKLVPVR